MDGEHGHLISLSCFVLGLFNHLFHRIANHSYESSRLVGKLGPLVHTLDETTQMWAESDGDVQMAGGEERARAQAGRPAEPLDYRLFVCSYRVVA